MKHIIIILIALSLLNCKAQTVVSMNNNGNYGAEGFYFKDINNDFNTFEGTWLYTDGNSSLKVTFQKKINNHDLSEISNYHFDALVGEYQYIENGAEKVNTLLNINNNHSDPYDYNLIAISVWKYGQNSCTNCEPGNKVVKARFNQPDCDIISSPQMIFRHYIESGVEKLHLNFISGTYVGNPLGIEPTCQDYAIPFGQYTLIKQD